MVNYSTESCKMQVNYNITYLILLMLFVLASTSNYSGKQWAGSGTRPLCSLGVTGSFRRNAILETQGLLPRVTMRDGSFLKALCLSFRKTAPLTGEGKYKR